jgi:adenosylmethionine-8-amino-7-oxononanoate aminotransferase
VSKLFTDALPDDATKALDRRFVWRPYTGAEEHQRDDLLVVAGAVGPYLFGTDGTRYIDATGSWWCSTLGHGHPRLRAALIAQVERFAHTLFAGATHEPAARLAAELVEIAPKGLERVFFSDNGSTSVEVALKIAFQAAQQRGETSRTRFLALPGAYHGDTFGAMSVGDLGAFRDVFAPLLFATDRPPPLDDPDDFEPAIAWIEDALATRGASYAALIVEPIVQGAAGMRIYPPAFLARLREATTRAGVLLIADEVFTAFGRTGKLFACEHAGITPDLMCLAKGLTGGTLPFAATLATKDVYDAFSGDRTRALMHGHTFAGHPLGAAVALEALSVYRDEGVIARAADVEARLRAGFSKISERRGVLRTRVLGGAAAADLGDGGYHGAIGWRVRQAALARGIFLRPLGDTVYVTPALTSPLPVIDDLVAGLDEAIGDALEE